MAALVPPQDALISEIRAACGWIDSESFELRQIDGMGWGAVASRDLPANTPLFYVPLHHVLTPFNSDLHSLLSKTDWASLGESHCEVERMPISFTTPMFWSDEQQQELVGTDIENRIGRIEAEDEYYTKLLPLIQTHPHLFPASSPHFSLQAFHVQGSRILSRSFTITTSRLGIGRGSKEVLREDETDEDDEGVAVMVPMADMLNAAFEKDNARLFSNDSTEQGLAIHDSKGEGYTMITTIDIAAGEQILNTYGSPPNSELLRKYGHIDLDLLSTEILSKLSQEEIGGWPYGNPGDEVQLDGQMVANVVGVEAGGAGTPEWKSKVKVRVDAWLDDGQDDTFSLSFAEPLDPKLVSFIQILLDNEAWHRFEKHGKLPNPLIDENIAHIVRQVLAQRVGRYKTGYQEDLDILLAQPRRSLCLRNSAAVRLGEKRILNVTLRNIEAKMMKRHQGSLKRRASETGEKGSSSHSRKRRPTEP